MATTATDAELVDASRRGDRAAFGELVVRCANMVSAIAFAASRDRSSSEELTQDTFVVAWSELTRLRDSSAVRPWLCRIARNLAHKARRRRDREVTIAELDAADERTPFDSLADIQTETIVRAALGRVPTIYREALVLFYYERQSVADVARALGVSESVVHKRLSRGRRQLADGIEKLVTASLRPPSDRRAIAACVLAALPLALTIGHGRAHAKGSKMLKVVAAGVVISTVAAVTTTAARSRATPPIAVHRPASATIPSRASTPPHPAPRLPTIAPAAPRAPLTCEGVAHHFLDLFDDADGSASLPLETECREQGWSQLELGCMAAADDAWSFDACKAQRPLTVPLATGTVDIRCEAIADRMLELSPPPAHDDRPAAQYASLHANIVDACSTEAWSEPRRRCMVIAPSIRAMVPCLALDKPTPIAPAIPASDASCAAVGAHVAEVIASSTERIFDQPQRVAASMQAICNEEHWPESHRRCLLGATRFARFMSCRVTT